MTPIFGLTQQKLLRFSTCMDKQCCSPSSSFSLFFDDSTTTRFTGSGTQQNPIKSNVNLSADAGNILTVRTDGLFAAGIVDVAINVEDSLTIDFSGDGTIATPLTGNVLISTTAGNILTSNATGLFVPPVSITTQNTSTITLSGNGALGTPLTAQAMLSPDLNNILEIHANGLYTPGPTNCVTEVTYDEMNVLINGDGSPEHPGSQLKPGCLYLITDYQSIGSILHLAYDGATISVTDSGTLYTGQIEPLLVRASSVFSLEPWGLMPNGNEVEYDFFAGTKGAITRRINKTLNINIPQDWYAVQYIYNNIAAGGSINDQTYKVFNGALDDGTSDFTRSTNGIYIGRNTYGQVPVVIFGATTNAIHFNVNAFVGGFFICNRATNISKGDFNYLNITTNLNGANDYV